MKLNRLLAAFAWLLAALGAWSLAPAAQDPERDVVPGLRAADPKARSALQQAFYPVAVWYGGGKVRAPMMSPLDATSAAQRGKDLD